MYNNKEKLTLLEKLFLVFNEKDSDELKKLIKGEKIMEEYRQDAIDASQKSEILGLYDKEKESERIEQIRLDYAREEGIEQGIEQGLEQGKKVGLEEGELQASLKIAKNLIKRGYSLEEVSINTELDIETLKNIEIE